MNDSALISIRTVPFVLIIQPLTVLEREITHILFFPSI